MLRLPWRGLVHRGGSTTIEFVAGRWPRWRLSWPTAFVALRRIPPALIGWWASSRAIAFAQLPSFAELRNGWAMSGPLLALNLIMASLSVFFVVAIVQTSLAPDFRAPSRGARTSAVAASDKNDVAARSSPLRSSYDVIATRNLFDPNRSDAKNLTAIVETLPPASTLLLHGVVISEDTRHAYLEDTATKRIVDYKIGDRVAGGEVQQIEPDRVIIMRAGGPIEVKLHDANRSRPVVTESPQQLTNAASGRRPAHDD
jgi:type II secretory pathway component PulC